MSSHPMNSTPRSTETTKWLSFRMGGQLLALELLKVREIIALQDCVPTPSAPPQIHGIVDLRDQWIPLLDMGHLLGVPSFEPHQESCIIVFEATDSSATRRKVGVVVEEIDEIHELSERQLRAPDERCAQLVPLRTHELLTLQEWETLDLWFSSVTPPNERGRDERQTA